MTQERLPVFILTGFLGSGKTTLLRQILAKSEFADSAVLINELGEVGLDHDLIAFSQESAIVLQGGCVCCTIREDVEGALRELFEARDAGRIQAFRRLIIETTGIADPHSLIVTLHANPLACARLMKPLVITVVDGVLGEDTLAHHKEATAQLTAADSVVVSKRDLSSAGGVIPKISRLNPWASVIHSDLLVDDLSALFPMTPVTPPSDSKYLGRFSQNSTTNATTVHDDVRVFCLVLERPLDWTAFGVWMTMLLHAHGQKILRIKGLLDIDGRDGPVAFHCAQHLVHPPQHFEQWPSSDRRSKLVFVMRDLDPLLVARSLKLVDEAAKQAPNPAQKRGYIAAGAGGSVAGRPIRRPTAPRWIKG
jgi:G3E family GTPase